MNKTIIFGIILSMIVFVMVAPGVSALPMSKAKPPVIKFNSPVKQPTQTIKVVIPQPQPILKTTTNHNGYKIIIQYYIPQ